MSASLRVLAREELELVAGGSLDPSMDPNWIPGGSSYGWSSVPVYSATSWTTSSFGSNYQLYATAAWAGGYANTNAYLQANSFYSGANAAGQAAQMTSDSAPPSTTMPVVENQPVSPGVDDGAIIVTAYKQLISFNGYWQTLGQLQSLYGYEYQLWLNQVEQYGTPSAGSPNSSTTNEITNLTAPDGAEYMVPEKVTAQYLLDAVNHVIDIKNSQGKIAAFQEIGRMYTDASSPFFVDFKRAGTSSGPASWQDGGNIIYVSASTGQTVHADAFEPFGNFFFGYLMTFAGAAFEETKAVAALVQGNGYQQLTSWNLQAMATAVANAAYYGDDPNDRPFVDHGAYLAAQYINNPQGNGYQFGVGN